MLTVRAIRKPARSCCRRSAVDAGLVLQGNVDLLAALLRSHACLTTRRGGIAIPGGGSVDFAPFGGLDPTLYLDVVGVSEPLDETRGNLTPERPALRM